VLEVQLSPCFCLNRAKLAPFPEKITGGFLGFFFYVLYLRMLGSNPGLLLPVTTRLHCRFHPEKITSFSEVEAMAKRRRGFKVSKSFKDHSVEQFCGSSVAAMGGGGARSKQMTESLS
jgi:hypothetical protein